MQPPNRLTVPTCVGCGAMSRRGTCELGCGVEERLDLVGADEHDELVAWVQACHARADVLRAVVRPLTGEPPLNPEREYRALQHAARAALREQRAPAPLPEPAGVHTTWWCPSCGGVDAPQPCLGICLWRPFEWVPAARHDELRAEAQDAAAEEGRLRALLRRAATVTPHPGQWDRAWAALAQTVAMR